MSGQHPTVPAEWAERCSLRQIELPNNLSMRIAEAGSTDGPLVLLVHGWPECWYSWRHQLAALAERGYYAVAPDTRGYGATDSPATPSEFDIKHLCSDLLGVLKVLGRPAAMLVGHDWGAVAGWQVALLHPQEFPVVCMMSVPYAGRGRQSPVDVWRSTMGDKFMYILYHNELDESGRTGPAEKEYDADPKGLLQRLYTDKTTPSTPPEITDSARSAGGWIGRIPLPTCLPQWLSQEDLDYYVNTFTVSGFRGGINYYRNFGRNWDLTPELDGKRVEQPSMFIYGENDPVIRMFGGKDVVKSRLAASTRACEIVEIPGVGHWLQQENPDVVNEAMIRFLDANKSSVSSKL